MTVAKENGAGAERGTQSIDGHGEAAGRPKPDNVTNGMPPDGDRGRNGARKMAGVVEVSVDELVDLRSKAKAFDDVVKQKSEVNTRNQKLKEDLEAERSRAEELAGTVNQFKEAGLDPKEFDVLKKTNTELTEALNATKQEASNATMQLLGMKFGVRDDEDCLGIFASKFSAAKAEANGDFDPAAFAEKLRSEKSYLFGESSAGVPTTPAPRRTPGGKGSAASSGGSQLEAQLQEIEAHIEALSKSPWAPKEELQSMRFERAMISKRIDEAKRG
jgi:hypothetical protein